MKRQRLWSLLLALPMVAGAQAWNISGRIVDAHGAPVAGARIEIEKSFQRSTSDSAGAFAFPGLQGDSVVLVARRLGYAAAITTVHRDPNRNHESVRIRLDAVPLRLSGVIVPGDARAPERHTLTRGSAGNLPALGEPDILRVLPFVGMVSQPNDMMGVVHLGGSAADEVSFSLDGHPVQAPLHFGGIFSGVNVAAIERVDVYSAHSPSGVPTRLGGLIDIQSRSPEERKRELALSVLSAGATALEPQIGGKVSLLGSARITYMDQVLDALRVGTIKGDAAALPSYADGIVRLTVPAAHGWKASSLLFVTQDKHPTGKSFPPIVNREVLDGIGLTRSGPMWSTTVGLSRDVFMVANDAAADEARTIDIKQTQYNARLSSVVNVRTYRVTSSLSLDERTHDLNWRKARFSTQLGTGLPDSSDQRQNQRVGYAAAEISRHLWTSTIGTVGARVYHNGRTLFTAPNVRLEWANERVTLIGTADRRYQFDGEFGPRVEETIAQPVYLFRDPRSSDGGAVTVKASRGNADRALSAEFSGFARQIYRRPVGVQPGQSFADTAVFSFRSARTVGAAAILSLSASRGASIQASYTFQRVFDFVSGMSQPSDWDIPHSLTAFAGIPLTGKWSLTGAFQGRSGLPVTPIMAEVFVPELREPFSLTPHLVYGERNSARLRAFRRLDLGARRRFSRGRAEWELSAQVINALGTSNAFAYDWRQYVQATARGAEPPPSHPGLPIVPSVGITVRW